LRLNRHKNNLMDSISVSLCISTYNSHKALKLCLESILFQTYLPKEILIGDDGSTEETRVIIENFKTKTSIPVYHIWQPDEGFRLAAIRNKCVAAVSNDYIIQIDGDLILYRKFIEDHVRFAKPCTFLCAARSLINKKAASVLENNGNIDWPYIHSNLNRRNYSIRSIFLATIVYYLKRGINQVKYIQGSNMSFWKKDLLTINGYNEEFIGWGKEDNDLAYRLMLSGSRIRFLKNAAIAFHLEHGDRSVERFHINVSLFNKTQKQKEFQTKNGINKFNII